MTRKELSFLAGLLMFIIIIVIASACGGARYHLARVEHHMSKAIHKGANVDSIHKVKWDTIKAFSFTDRIRTGPPVINEMEIKGLFAELSKIDLSKPVNTEIVNRIAEVVCPEVAIDTTYNLELFAQGDKYILPVTVKITSSGKEHEYSIKTGTLRVPVKVETNQIGISAGHGFWYDVKLAAFSLIAGALVMFFLIRAGPLKNFTIRIENKDPP